MHCHNIVRTLRRIALLLVALASLPVEGMAQTKWYTITGIAGVQYQEYDEYLHAAIWNVGSPLSGD